MFERKSPFNIVTSFTVITCNLTKGEIGVYCRAPFLFLTVPVNINQSYVHFRFF